MNARILNRNLQVYNPDLLEGGQVAHLTADTASGGASLVVDNISGFSVDQWVLIGNFGEKTAEIIKLHASTIPIGSTITLAANTAFDHYTDTPITILQFNQVEFSRAETLTGDKSVLATVAVAADRTFTSYTDITNSTGYMFARYKNSTSSTFSAYSTGINYATGNPANSFEKIAEEAVAIAGNTIGDDFAKLDQLLRDVNEAQDFVSQFQDWSFELVKDDTSIAATENCNTYNLGALTYECKYPQTYQSFLNVRFADKKLDYIDVDTMDEKYENTHSTTLNANVLAGATSFTVTDSYELAESGTVYIGPNTIAYTGNTQSTGTLTGCSGVVSAMTSGDTVWQQATPSLPTKYTVFAEDIVLDCPVDTSYVGFKLKIKYLKKLNALTDFSSVTEIPFYKALPWFIAHKIQTRKQNHDEATKFLEKFTLMVQLNGDRYKLPMLEKETYYKFSDKEEYGSTQI